MGRGRMEERLALRNKPFLGEQIHMYMIFDSLSFLDIRFLTFSGADISKILQNFFRKNFLSVLQIPQIFRNVSKFANLPFGGIYYLYTPNGKLRICSEARFIWGNLQKVC